MAGILVQSLREYFTKLRDGENADFPNVFEGTGDYALSQELMDIIEGRSEDTDAFEEMRFFPRENGSEKNPAPAEALAAWKGYIIPLLRRCCLQQRAKILYDYINGKAAGPGVNKWHDNNGDATDKVVSAVSKKLLNSDENMIKIYQSFIEDLSMDFGMGENASFKAQADLIDEKFDLLRKTAGAAPKYVDNNKKVLFDKWVNTFQSSLKNVFSDALKDIEREKDFKFYFGDEEVPGGGIENFRQLLDTIIFATPEVQDYFKTLPKRAKTSNNPEKVDLNMEQDFADAESRLEKYIDNVVAFQSKSKPKKSQDDQNGQNSENPVA